MRIYIFEQLEQVSDNYHCEGGAAIVAEDKRHAKKLIEAMDNLEVTDEEWKYAISYTLARKQEPRVFIFPDAGCC